MIDAYPLQWPMGWPRTKWPERARFDTGFATARNELMRELNLLGATNIIISSNIELRRDGLPYSGRRQPEDTAIAVYFKLNGEDQCVPCDKWTRSEDNLQAIRKTIEALRGLERWGAKEMVNAAFRGFKALPANIIVGAGTMRSWSEVLQVSYEADWDVIEAAYKRLLHKVHPDKGGTVEAFTELQNAFKQAKQERL